MKKHIIAAAVAAAVAVPAMAQNVSVYGRIDAGYTNYDNRATATSGVRFNNDTTSRIGFAGGEDLGGGLKATFALEGRLGVSAGSAAATTIQSNTGAAYTVATNGTDLAFGGFTRKANVALSGSFGEISLGLDAALSKNLYDTFNVGGASNTVGSATNVLSNSQFGAFNTGVKYTTPSFNGLKGSVLVMRQRTDNADVNNGEITTVGTGAEYALSYAAGPVKAMVVVLSTEGARTAGAEALENDLGATSFGVSYDFGAFVVSGLYGSTKLDATGGATRTKSNVSEIGVSVPLGALTVFASGAQGEQANDNTQAVQVGARYALSKRTYAYGVYGKTDIDATGVTQKQYSAGVVHQF